MSSFSLAVIFRAGAVILAVLALGSALHAAATVQANFSGNNFEYPGFGTDGYKSWDIQGNQFTTTSADNAPVEITGMKLHLYSGGPSLALETIIESQQATVLTGQSQAHGSDQLDIIGSNNTYGVHGFDWLWDGKSQIIRVGRNVLVTFRAVATASAHPTAKPSQPITITSDTLEIHQEQKLNRFIFSGNILVTDGECQTKCDALEVRADRSAIANPNAPAQPVGNAPAGLGVGRIEQIVATHNVLVTQGDLEARSETAELSPGDQRVVLSGSPQVRALSNDALLEGGRIVWQRDSDEVDVEPLADAVNGSGRVKVTLPELASFQGGADHSTASSSKQRMVITGESLHGQLGAVQRRFDIDKSVLVDDQSLNVSADHLDAEFDPPTTVAPTIPSVFPGTAPPEVGRLNHLTTKGNVKIDQDNRTTTTQQADIDPVKGQILLTGSPHVLDTLSHATIDGNRLELSIDGRNALVTGVPGEPAKLVLASMPGVTDAFGSNVPTTVIGDSVTMQRGDEYSNFTFTGRVHVTARDLETTCGELDAYTRNFAPESTPAGGTLAANKPAADPLGAVDQMGEIQELIARNFVEITQRRTGARQNDYQAHAARAEIYPEVQVASEASGPATNEVSQRRFVQLFGDPTGVEGPVRPEVEMPPMQAMGVVASGTTGTPAPVSGVSTKVTSDQQWLTTSSTGSTYYFEGNVQIDGGTFQASCDKMQAEGAPAKSATGSGPAGPVVLEQVIAEGSVRITQGTRVSTAGKALILPHEGRVELSENALVVDSANGGSRLENANLEISQGEVAAVSIPGVPGQPLVRPTLVLPSNAFDKVRKPVDKPSAGTSP